MKKICAALLIVLLFVGPASATLLIDKDTTDPLTDINPLYWTGSDTNPSDALDNSNPRSEEAWLEAVLGLVYDDLSVNYYDKIEYGDKPISDINVLFSWDYAVVKYATNWAAYQDDFSGSTISNVSHITFFNGNGNGNGNGAPVPEPATILLLGAGLIGLSAYGRKKFHN